MNHYVEVVEKATGNVIKRMGPMSERKAGKVCDGVLINLNRDEYYVRTVSE